MAGVNICASLKPTRSFELEIQGNFKVLVDIMVKPLPPILNSVKIKSKVYFLSLIYLFIVIYIQKNTALNADSQNISLWSRKSFTIFVYFMFCVHDFFYCSAQSRTRIMRVRLSIKPMKVCKLVT